MVRTEEEVVKEVHIDVEIQWQDRYEKQSNLYTGI